MGNSHKLGEFPQNGELPQIEGLPQKASAKRRAPQKASAKQRALAKPAASSERVLFAERFMPMTRYFGTDGIRGVANEELTCAVAFALGIATVELLGSPLVVGRDTRRSGAMLESALVAGITAAGGDALLAGIIPTPAVAFLTKTLQAAGGVVVSASHNAPKYNGLKVFDGSGFKSSPDLESRIEQRLCALLEDTTLMRKAMLTGNAIGMASTLDNAAERYIEHAISTVADRISDLSGVTIAADCGHGASSYTTPQAFLRLGAKVVAINTDFTGDDINVECGSTHLDSLIQLVRRVGADVGIAHDGDADRVIMVDSTGAVIDGDFMALICALDLEKRAALPHNTVVTTRMCNLGFIRAVESCGINVIQTAVGDSNVLAAMREGGYMLGGEQSGHMIFLGHNTTGDGLITALQVLAIMKTQSKSLHELAQVMRKYPQALINVRVADTIGREELSLLDIDSEFGKDIAQTERTLQENGGGRVLVRVSGTEPLIRVMVEAATETFAQEQAAVLAEIIRRRYGLAGTR